MPDKITVSTFQLFEMFPDQESARKYLETRLWPDGVKCPFCGRMENITTRKNGFYRCNECGIEFFFCGFHLSLRVVVKMGVFIKQIQCVFAALPDRCPNSGFLSVSDKTSLVLIWISAHLKTKTPSAANTRKHSASPLRKSSRQLSRRMPYFFPIQLSGPAFLRWGGSNTTNLKLPSSNGRAVKSTDISGLMFSARPSHKICSSVRISPKRTSGFSRSNQNILDPQHGSRIFFPVV